MLLMTSADVRLNVGVETIQGVQIAVTREIALWTVCRRRLKDEVFREELLNWKSKGLAS
jgi:hypothetical protein